MKPRLTVLLLLLVVAGLAGCAPAGNPLVHTHGPQGSVAGFWLGLWHGFIVLVTFVVSLFSDHVNVYEAHNNGGWYNFGFVLGATMALGGPSHGAARSRWGRRA